ncbi:aminotransferase class I/II-fold pyridoxal phosphate-dependent enzyme [Halopiger goleimassiliensis]|uniref:aminotransferase class I/II-fold pyridoxal phosphate-dependent enzyme n=1 Tax=Halopiger goleimassiliensis TaxID=1293048 RepID=UPI000677ABC9|nr:aminotransferase class I/II-fold pyridoxal phosphate-dependent enzyme [Halopiger goleimassiliensis]
MQIDDFALERWFAAHEHDADLMLAESGVRSLESGRFDTDPGELGYVIPTNGDPEIRERIAARYDRDADEVLCTCGTQEANFLAFHTLLEPDDHAVVVTPTYQSLRTIPETICDVTTVELEPPTWELSVDAVSEAVRPETELIVVNNPNNPTGRYHPRETLEALYDLASDADAYLFCDEVYRKLAEQPHPPAASLGPRAISTAGLSKAYGLAGLRFGWLVADREVIDAAWNWKDYTTISPPTISQHVASQALEREDEILAENRAHAVDHRERVREFVDRHDLEWYEPVGVNVFVTIPEGFESGRAFCEAVLEEGVVLAPGEFFGHPDRFRIGFGLPTGELETGLERIEGVLESR